MALNIVRCAATMFCKVACILLMDSSTAAKRCGVDCTRNPCLIANTRAVENKDMMPPIFKSIRPSSSLKRPNRPSGGEFLQALIDMSLMNCLDSRAIAKAWSSSSLASALSPCTLTASKKISQARMSSGDCLRNQV